jgi:hypothetical protein
MPDLTSWLREISTGVIVKIIVTTIVAVLTFLVAYARGFRLRSPFTRRTVVQIVSPSNGAVVGPRETVRGTIKPPGPVLVFVLANDNYWYLQNRPQVVRDAWNVECVFGDEKSKRESSYEVIAIAGEAVGERRARLLPHRGARSQQIRVWRGRPS